jgi:hypothetical protein
MSTPVRRRFAFATFATLSLVLALAPQPVFAATARSNISVTISASRHTVGPGQRVVYTATMTNHGPNDASFVDLVFTWSGKVNPGIVGCGHGIGPDGNACEYSTLKSGETVVSVLPASAMPGSHRGDRLTVRATVAFEVDCAVDPNCTFDPNRRDNSASVTTRVR